MMNVTFKKKEDAKDSLPFDKFNFNTTYTSKVIGSIITNGEDTKSVHSDTNSLCYSPSLAVYNQKYSKPMATIGKNVKGAKPKVLKFDDYKENANKYHS